MARSSVSDVIVVGGGLAGSCLAGVLARAGLGVLILEKEPRFRDRVRGEGTWPWGVAHARQAGLDELFAQADVLPVRGKQRFADREAVETNDWSAESREGDTELVFSHAGLQEAAIAWAAGHGATVRRPAKAIGFRHDGRPVVTAAEDGQETEYAARLVVGADGRQAGTRRWTGGETAADAEHHRFGGVLIRGAQIDVAYDNYSWEPGLIVNWFPAGAHATRLYLGMTAARLRQTGIDRSFAANLACAADYMPDGALAGVEQIGPIGYFPSNDLWATAIVGNDVVLIGDAAGAPDPTQGHGTPLVFHDVHVLSDLLLHEPDWAQATRAFAARREEAFAVIREYDRWHTIIHDEGAEAARRRERQQRAAEADPSLGGFAFLEARGPAGLVADEAAQRHFFGDDLA
jgi:2-polyprenyl-6-methoxyphenol hydroxylase-like FAD-dependent oxidoreductase